MDHSRLRRAFAMFLVAVMVIGFAFNTNTITANAASKKYVTKITVKKKVTVNVKKSTTVKVTIKGTKGVSKAVTIKSSNSKVAAAKKTSKGIKITGKKAGKAKITVTTKAKNKKGKKLKATITVTVKGTTPSKPEDKYNNVKITTPTTTDGSSPKVNVGGTTKLTATVDAADAAKVVWSSTNPSVAKIDADGTVTGVASGSVEAIATMNGKEIGRIKLDVVVPAVEVTGVTLTINPTSIAAGQAAVATAVVTPDNASDKTVTFKSSNEAVAAVNAQGVVAGIAPGTATITATTSNGKTATAEIKVESIPVTAIKISGNSEITVGGTTALTATITPDNASDKTVTWSSKNEAVAKVNASGVVTGVDAGTAEIIATSSNNIVDKFTVTVTREAVEADGVTLDVFNPYVDANGTKYPNTTLVGRDMTVRVRVIKDGKPVGNDNVTLTMDPLYGNAGSCFEIRNNTAKTNENGYVDFAIGLNSNNSKLNAVSGYAQSFNVKAQESNSNKTGTVTVSFASVYLSGIKVLNGTAPEYPALVPEEEAGPSDNGKYSTYAYNSLFSEEYVSSQQVSTAGVDHKVYMTAAPYLLLPPTSDDGKTGAWSYPLTNGKAGSYSVYNDVNNTSTTITVADIPAGLQNISLNYNKLDLSKYSALYVDVYAKDGGVAGQNIFHKEYTSVNNSSSKGVCQIERQNDVDSLLVVSLITKGQVDTSSKGFEFTELTGLWKSTDSQDPEPVEIAGAVTWSKDDEVRYETNSWTYEAAKDYIPDAEFKNSSYSYLYKVPGFPRTGDALILVNDAAGNPIANYIYPVVNNGKNVNVLAPVGSKKAINSSNDAVENEVGSISTDGNIVIVDSTQTGRTNLKATVKVAGLTEKEIDDQNGGVLYTSVQWAPIPNQEQIVEVPDFFAVEGQTVVVTAQLFDSNGNKKTTASQQVQFAYGDDATVIGKTDKKIGQTAEIVSISNNGATDSNGQVKLTLKDVTSNTDWSWVDKLTASSAGYNVKLSLDATGDYVEVANISWVDLGLTFVDSAVSTDNPVRTTGFENETTTINKGATYVVSDTNGWQIGFIPVARCRNEKKFAFTQELDRTPYVTNEFISLGGVGVSYSSNNEDAVTQANNVATISTTASGEISLTGYLDIADLSKVTFTYYDAEGNVVTKPNIGQGTSTVINNTALKLNTTWNTTGTDVEIIAPTQVNANSDAYVYVKVVDNYGNKLSDQLVEYTINGVNETSGSKNTDANGIAEIYLPVPTDISASSSTISVKVAGSVEKNTTINYSPAQSTPFDIDSITIGADNTTIDVVFTQDVLADTILDKEFTFVQDGATDITYTVQKAEAVSGNKAKVRLTLDKAITNLSASHTLTVQEYTDNSNMKHRLSDSFGQVITNASMQITPAGN